jgi:RNA polymerase sigma-70 factor, ECF subfamily
VSDGGAEDARSPLLVARAQAGDRAALDRLLRAVQGPLFAHLRAITGDDEGARDVLQDALLIVCRKLPSLRDPRWFRAWAYRIATRECLRRHQRDRLWREALRDEALDGALHGAALHDAAAAGAEPPFEPELVAAVPREVDALPPASRVVVRMHYLDGLTYVEIAEALELSVGTVKSRLAYGLSLLRRRLAGAATP